METVEAVILFVVFGVFMIFLNLGVQLWSLYQQETFMKAQLQTFRATLSRMSGSGRKKGEAPWWEGLAEGIITEIVAKNPRIQKMADKLIDGMSKEEEDKDSKSQG